MIAILRIQNQTKNDPRSCERNLFAIKRSLCTEAKHNYYTCAQTRRLHVRKETESFLASISKFDVDFLCITSNALSEL